MPPHVYCDAHGFFYRNATTGDYARFPLPPDAAQSAVWAAYETIHAPRAFKVGDLIDEYLRSPQYKGLSKGSQENYRRNAAVIRAVFGEMEPDSVTSPHGARFMDTRGTEHPSAANHERAFARMLWTWGKERGFVSVQNPWDAVKTVAIKKTAGKAHTDDDHLAFYNFLIECGYIMQAAGMEIAYCCGSRQQDVRRIYERAPIRPKEEDCYVCDEGIVIWQKKTGRVQLKEWTPRLRAAVELARKHKAEPRADGTARRMANSPWLICTSSGTPYTRGGFNSNWGRAQREAAAAGIIERFRFHDTKHKGITDLDGTEAEKQHFSGHASGAMVRKYDHSIPRTRTVDKPLDARTGAGHPSRKKR